MTCFLALLILVFPAFYHGFAAAAYSKMVLNTIRAASEYGLAKTLGADVLSAFLERNSGGSEARSTGGVARALSASPGTVRPKAL
jgi:hypothetical protein